MDAAPLILCERSGGWAVAWRKCWAATVGRRPCRVVETRSAAECRDVLQELKRAGTAAGFVVAELSAAQLTETLDLLATIEREFPEFRTAAVANRSLQAMLDPVVRELGAVDLVVSPRRLAPLVRTAAKHLARQAGRELNERERIMDSLPWKPSPSTMPSGVDQ
jgi:hypothetical protein